MLTSDPEAGVRATVGISERDGEAAAHSTRTACAEEPAGRQNLSCPHGSAGTALQW